MLRVRPRQFVSSGPRRRSDPSTTIRRRRSCLSGLQIGSWLAALALLGCLAGCDRSPADDPGASAESLVSRWSDVRIDDPVPAPEPPPRWEIRFDDTTSGDTSSGDTAASKVTWKALQGVENLRVEDGRLVGRTTSEQPAILLELPEPAGGGDELWSVETRLEVAEGSRMGVHPVLEPGPPMPANLTRIEDWPVSSPLLPGAGTKTYTTELDDVFLLEMMPATREPQKILLRPTNASGTDFAVDSVRLVFRRENLASIGSGPGWHGLGEVFRETLVSRGGETLAFRTELPPRPWLELAVGAVDEPLPTFEVSVAPVDADETGDAEIVAELRPEAADAWRLERIDLSRWAGQSVELRLRALRDGDGTALPSFWGTPTVRGSLAGSRAESAKTAADGAPNRPRTVILFLADTLRSDHLEAWGHDRETAPTVARLAAEGVRFDDAIAQSTWTKVSVSSILTSLYPSTSGVVGMSDRISAGETTLAEVFRDAGYATFATSSVPFSGQLTNLHQGVEVLYEYGAVPRGDGAHPTKTSRLWIDAYLEWLELHRDVPTFAFVHVMDPHSPFEPDEPYDTMWATEDEAARFAEQSEQVRPHIESPLWRRFMAPTQRNLDTAGVDAESFVAHEKNWYDGSIRSMDVEIERMMSTLADLGLEDETLLAFVSDHGEEFLEHGNHWHGTSVYGELTNVPMALWGRGVPSGVVVERTVETVDLLPTLVELAGLEPPERAQGESLVPLMRGETPRAVPAFSQLPARPGEVDRYAIVDGRWKLVWNRGLDEARANAEDAATLPETEFELYDHDADPLNLDDVSADHPDVVDKLAAQLDRWRTWAEEQRLDEDAATSEMSAEELEQLRSLGYID